MSALLPHQPSCPGLSSARFNREDPPTRPDLVGPIHSNLRGPGSQSFSYSIASTGRSCSSRSRSNIRPVLSMASICALGRGLIYPRFPTRYAFLNPICGARSACQEAMRRYWMRPAGICAFAPIAPSTIFTPRCFSSPRSGTAQSMARRCAIRVRPATARFHTGSTRTCSATAMRAQVALILSLRVRSFRDRRGQHCQRFRWNRWNAGTTTSFGPLGWWALVIVNVITSTPVNSCPRMPSGADLPCVGAWPLSVNCSEICRARLRFFALIRH